MSAVEPFAIATIEVRPGRIGISRLPGRYGNLEAEVETISGWDAALVVSMTTSEELRRAGIDLDARLSAAAIDWRHFPVGDFGVPDTRGNEAWAALSRELHRALDTGSGILLHCKGGIGRSGMVAMRLLVERGMEPDTALAIVRSARPGAVETAEQRLWAAGPARLS